MEHFLRWIGGRDAPNLDKGNQFFTILFCLKYHPNDKWEMDEDVEGEWDAAVESLMDQLSSNKFGPITLPIALAKGVCFGTLMSPVFQPL